MPVMHSCDVSFILGSCSEEQVNTVPNSRIVQPMGQGNGGLMKNLHTCTLFKILNYKAEPSHPGVNVTYQQKIKR